MTDVQKLQTLRMAFVANMLRHGSGLTKRELHAFLRELLGEA